MKQYCFLTLGLLLLALPFSANSQTAISSIDSTYLDRPHFVVTTPSAVYYYDIAGGGFSKILDSYGNDWINFKKVPWDEYPASAASSYRGLPNLVFNTDPDTGAGHPGHDKCKSDLVGGNKIRTVTKSGKWEWEWTFYDSYAVLEILKTNGESPYWFLYEGTPGGKYTPQDYSYGTDVSGLNTDLLNGTAKYGNFQWAYFNRKGVEDTFFIIQLKKDDKLDLMTYLGNTKKEGVQSKDGMTVFGFGRGKKTKALLTGPNTFIIGMYPKAINSPSDYRKLSKKLSKKIKKINTI